MFNIGGGEIAVILIVALLLLGPQKLPELARGLGKFMREFRRQTDEVRTMVEREFYAMDQELQRTEAPPKAVPSTVQKTTEVGTAEGGPVGAAEGGPVGTAEGGPVGTAEGGPGSLVPSIGSALPDQKLYDTQYHAMEANGLDPTAPTPLVEGSSPAEAAPPAEGAPVKGPVAPVAEAKNNGAPQESTPRGR